MIRLGGPFGKSLLALGAVASLSAAAPAFDPEPWLEDLAQAKAALGEKYANLEWAEFEREADLPRLFTEAQAQIEAASSDAQARAAFDGIARRLGDGHVLFRWPTPATKADGGAPGDLCARLGYNAGERARGVAQDAPGYSALETAQSVEFPAGLVEAGGKRVGLLQIPLFSAYGWPELCRQALTALAIPPDRPCNNDFDGDCSDRVQLWAERRMTRDLSAQIRALEAAGAEVLAVDITGNGGGSEWFEAAARMLTPIRLSSERAGFVRGEHWVRKLTDREAELRKWADSTTGEDRSLLLRLADAAAADRRTAATPCDGAPIWRGRRPACQWLGERHSTLRSADAHALRDKPWGPVVFAPVKYGFDEGVWRGPLIVVVDGGTGSASEAFASMLQDNRAALIMGSPTHGAGCGYTDGGTPTTLTHSGGVLIVPDCVFGAPTAATRSWASGPTCWWGSEPMTDRIARLCASPSSCPRRSRKRPRFGPEERRVIRHRPRRPQGRCAARRSVDLAAVQNFRSGSGFGRKA